MNNSETLFTPAESFNACGPRMTMTLQNGIPQRHVSYGASGSWESGMTIAPRAFSRGRFSRRAVRFSYDIPSTLLQFTSDRVKPFVNMGVTFISTRHR